MRRRIVVALSTTFSVRGGIQRFNRLLCRALDELCPALELEGWVLGQGDTARDVEACGSAWRHLRFVAGGSRTEVVGRTWNLCRREQPDLLLIGHLGMTPMGVVCLPWVRGGFGFIAHGTEAWDEPRWTRRFAARRARFAFAVSRDTAGALARSTGVREERIRWLPNTLQPGFDGASPAPAVAGRDLLTVSRLQMTEEAKGVDVAIEAFARLAGRHPATTFHIVGGGTDKPRLVELARRQAPEDRIRFHENLSDDELSALYRDCALFLLPSGQEGFGIVFLEAMCFAKPCIGGNAGGTPEVIEDGVTGLLVPYGDVGRLEQAIDRLLGDPALRAEMGRAGHRRLTELFTFDRFRARLDHHLRALLDGPS